MEEEIWETGLAEKSGNRMVRVGVLYSVPSTGCGSMALQKIWLVSDL